MNGDQALLWSIIIAAVAVLSYAAGSIPWAYLIVKWVAREDISQHGTGNVGAMNVKRTTGSWGWFTVAMVADAFKGMIPALVAKGIITGFNPLVVWRPWSGHLTSSMPPEQLGVWTPAIQGDLVPMAAVLGAVLGHNYSVWLAIRNRKLARTGKGLATGGGALIAYDWRYFVVAVLVGLLMIAVTRYMMAGQVAAAAGLPLYAVVTGQPDWPFMVLLGLIVYAAHHKRFIGLLRGDEPRFYTNDRMGPRG